MNDRAGVSAADVPAADVSAAGFVLTSRGGESVARGVSTASTFAAGKSVDSWVAGYHPLDVYPLLLFSRHYVTPWLFLLSPPNEINETGCCFVSFVHD